MRHHPRVAALVTAGFALILLSVVLGAVGGGVSAVARPAALLLGVVGVVVFLVSGFWYTTLFVRSLLRPPE